MYISTIQFKFDATGPVYHIIIYARNAFKAALNRLIGVIASRYGGDGVFARRNDARIVLECMQQWRDSCASSW